MAKDLLERDFLSVHTFSKVSGAAIWTFRHLFRTLIIICLGADFRMAAAYPGHANKSNYPGTALLEQSF